MRKARVPDAHPTISESSVADEEGDTDTLSRERQLTETARRGLTFFPLRLEEWELEIRGTRFLGGKGNVGVVGRQRASHFYFPQEEKPGV